MRKPQILHWHRRLVPVVIFWIIFITINSTINQAPYGKEHIGVLNLVYFFMPLFLASYFTLGYLLRSKQRGIIGSLIVCILLLFRLYDLTSFVNVALVFAFAGFLDWYLKRGKGPEEEITKYN